MYQQKLLKLKLIFGQLLLKNNLQVSINGQLLLNNKLQA